MIARNWRRRRLQGPFALRPSLSRNLTTASLRSSSLSSRSQFPRTVARIEPCIRLEIQDCMLPASGYLVQGHRAARTSHCFKMPMQPRLRSYRYSQLLTRSDESGNGSSFSKLCTVLMKTCRSSGFPRDNERSEHRCFACSTARLSSGVRVDHRFQRVRGQYWFGWRST